MILNNADNIMIDSIEVNKVFLGTSTGSTTQYFQFSKGIFVGLADHPWGRQVASIQL